MTLSSASPSRAGSLPGAWRDSAATPKPAAMECFTASLLPKVMRGASRRPWASKKTSVASRVKGLDHVGQKLLGGAHPGNAQHAALDALQVGHRFFKTGPAGKNGDSGLVERLSGAWDSLRTTRVFLKAPITTPQGTGYKSLNVTVRENEEDLYAGIEHRQTDEVYQCLKLITRPGCEKIVRYAFDYARAHGRKKVTCMTKDNIMKMSDGLFHKVFDEVLAHYPEMITEHYIIDIGAARLATRPQVFPPITDSAGLCPGLRPPP